MDKNKKRREAKLPYTREGWDPNLSLDDMPTVEDLLKKQETVMLDVGHECPRNAGIYIMDFKKAASGLGIRKRKGYIVLCLNPGVFSPFVTWWMGADIGDCSHGNYFVDLTEAVKDFNERT